VTSPASLRQYNTSDGLLQRAVVLPDYVEYLYHGVETDRGTFVIGYRGTELSELSAAVSAFSSLWRCQLGQVPRLS